MKELKNVSTLVRELGAEGIMKRFFGDVKYQEYHPEYKCLCDRQTIESVLISLGKEELYDILKTEEKIKVDCQFCDKVYEFDKSDVDGLFK
jgi:molecular chaperone Hsp33